MIHFIMIYDNSLQSRISDSEIHYSCNIIWNYSKSPLKPQVPGLKMYSSTFTTVREFAKPCQSHHAHICLNYDILHVISPMYTLISHHLQFSLWFHWPPLMQNAVWLFYKNLTIQVFFINIPIGHILNFVFNIQKGDLHDRAAPLLYLW